MEISILLIIFGVVVGVMRNNDQGYVIVALGLAGLAYTVWRARRAGSAGQ